MNGQTFWTSVIQQTLRFFLPCALFILVLMPRLAFAQTEESQQTLKWFAGLSPTQEIQACDFVRIDVELKAAPATKLLGYDFGLLISSTDEKIDIWSHCLLMRSFSRNCRIGDDLFVVSYTRFGLRETLSNLESIYENRRQSFANVRKCRALCEELLRYPLLPRNRMLLVLQLFHGLQGGNIDEYIGKSDVQTLEYPYHEYAHPSLGHLQEKSKFELIRFVVSEILCEYYFRRLTDSTVNLNDCIHSVEKLLRCDLEESSRGYLRRQSESLRRMEALEELDVVAPSNSWQEIERKCRILTNLPLEYIRDGVAFDEQSSRVWGEIQKQLNSDDILPLSQSNDPTRCIFIRNNFDYSPRVLTVGELFGDTKELEGTVEPPAEKTSGQSDAP
jgi:hypothetical protein